MGEPPTYPTGQCSSCQAPIIWAVTANTLRRIPVDLDPVGPDAGNVLLTATGGEPRAEVVRNPARLFGARWVYRSHFVTCPFAAHHRGRARRKAAS